MISESRSKGKKNFLPSASIRTFFNFNSWKMYIFEYSSSFFIATKNVAIILLFNYAHKVFLMWIYFKTKNLCHRNRRMGRYGTMEEGGRYSFLWQMYTILHVFFFYVNWRNKNINLCNSFHVLLFPFYVFVDKFVSAVYLFMLILW